MTTIPFCIKVKDLELEVIQEMSDILVEAGYGLDEEPCQGYDYFGIDALYGDTTFYDHPNSFSGTGTDEVHIVTPSTVEALREYLTTIGRGKMSDFVHTSPERVGFYRNSAAALSEALVMKNNAASGPQRPLPVPSPLREEVEAKICDIMYEQLVLKSPANLSDEIVGTLGADSLDTVEIVMAVEECFEVEISDEDAEKVVTVQDACDLICKLLDNAVITEVAELESLKVEKKGVHHVVGFDETSQFTEEQVQILSTSHTNLTVADLVLRQTKFHNGHGQMEISEMSISSAFSLLKELEEASEEDNAFTLELWPDSSASIYEQDGIESGDSKLWLGIDKITELLT